MYHNFAVTPQTAVNMSLDDGYLQQMFLVMV